MCLNVIIKHSLALLLEIALSAFLTYSEILLVELKPINYKHRAFGVTDRERRHSSNGGTELLVCSIVDVEILTFLIIICDDCFEVLILAIF